MSRDLACPVCDSGDTHEFLRRSNVPVHQNQLMSEATAARDMPRGELAFRACHGCGFVFNPRYDPSLQEYGRAYDNSQMFSPAFQTHVEALVERLSASGGLRRCRIVEVGCGQGDFLRRLVADPQRDNRGIGFDPAYRGPLADLGGRLTFQQRFFDRRCGDVAADVVVCRHVIEHVADPRSLLQGVREGVAHSPRARVFFETPCAEWILRHGVVWDFFYEHCSLFTAQSLRTAFQRAGFRVDRVENVFGEQYLWLEAAPAFDSAPTWDADPGAIPRLAEDYRSAEAERRDRWERILTRLEGRGLVALWGAGAKGVTFANLVDPDARRICCIVDLNPAKQQRFLPGTGHPIVGPAELASRRIASVLILNPNYAAEIRRTVEGLGLELAVVDLMNLGEDCS